MSTTETYATRNDPVQIRTPDGCLLAVRRFGPQNGPPVLLLGGGEGAMRRWRGLLPALCVDDREREAFAGAGSEQSLGEHLRVVVFDPRGTGWSSRSHGVARTVKEAAADALAVAAALFDGPFHLVGHSLGGCVALEVALAGGKLVRSLALLSSTAGGEGRTPPDDEYLALRETAGDPLSQPDVERQADVLRRQVELTFSPAFAQAHPELLALLTHEAARELRWQRRLAARGADVAEAAAAHAARLASAGPRRAPRRPRRPDAGRPRPPGPARPVRQRRLPRRAHPRRSARTARGRPRPDHRTSGRAHRPDPPPRAGYCPALRPRPRV